MREARAQQQQPLILPQRKGRPPAPATTSTLTSEARAMLARANGDMPPRADGFGAKVSADRSQLLTMFPSTTVPKRLEVSAEEQEQRRVAAMVNASEEESLNCLSGLLKSSEKAMCAVLGLLSLPPLPLPPLPLLALPPLSFRAF